MVLAPWITIGLCSDVLCGRCVHVRAHVHTRVCMSTYIYGSTTQKFPFSSLIALLSHAFGIHYPWASGASGPVPWLTVIWFIEIIWQGNRPWKTELWEAHLMNFLWFESGFILPCGGRTPQSTHTRPGSPARSGGCDNEHTVFFLHTSRVAFPIWEKKKREPCKGSKIWAGNHTEWRLPLSLAINVTTRAGRRKPCQGSGWWGGRGTGYWGGGCSLPFTSQGWLKDWAGHLPMHSQEIPPYQFFKFILKQGAQVLISYTMFLPPIFTFCGSIHVQVLSPLDKWIFFWVYRFISLRYLLNAFYVPRTWGSGYEVGVHL